MRSQQKNLTSRHIYLTMWHIYLRSNGRNVPPYTQNSVLKIYLILHHGYMSYQKHAASLFYDILPYVPMGLLLMDDSHFSFRKL